MTTRAFGLADYAFFKGRIDDRGSIDWFDAFAALCEASDTSVCHSFSRRYDTYATEEQVEALLKELDENGFAAARASLQQLLEQKAALECYVFFEGDEVE